MATSIDIDNASAAAVPGPRRSRVSHVRPVTTGHRPGKGSGQVRPLDQEGYALIWMAMLMIVLVGFAGFGVDTARLWYSGQKMQQAADAAALAGVVFLPGDLAGGIDEARKVASRNGFTDGVNGDTVTPTQDPNNPDRLRVQITHTEPTTFVAVLGVKKVNIKRSSTAEYQGPVPMGSPTNNMGNQPTWTGGPAAWAAGSGLTAAQQLANTTPQLWAQIAAPSTDKGNGDRFAAGYCSSTFYNCSGSNNLEPYVVNSDGTYGYFYKLKINVTDLTKRLSVQVYDPAFVQQGDTCTGYSSDGAEEDTFEAKMTTAAGTTHPNWDPDNAGAAGMCPGDHFIRSGYAAPTTYFKMYQTDLTPWNDTDNPAVNQATYCNESNNAATSTTNYPGTFPGIAGNTSGNAASLASLLSVANTSTNAQARYAQLVFHNYVTVCNASMSELGITSTGEKEVVLRVRSSAGAGHNRFAIRGALVTNTSNATPDGSKVSVYADGRLPMYMNASGSQTIFYIARLLPNNGSHTLELNLYDVGDAAANGSIQILPPAEATSGGSAMSNFSGCIFSRAPSAINTGDVNSGSCTLNNVNSANGYNGQLVVVAIPIPASYSCASTDRFGCWVRVKFSYPTGTGVTDTTTWTANLKGDPVRLIS